jgi:hypothetical protein
MTGSIVKQRVQESRNEVTIIMPDIREVPVNVGYKKRRYGEYIQYMN